MKQQALASPASCVSMKSAFRSACFLPSFPPPLLGFHWDPLPFLVSRREGELSSHAPSHAYSPSVCYLFSIFCCCVVWILCMCVVCFVSSLPGVQDPSRELFPVQTPKASGTRVPGCKEPPASRSGCLSQRLPIRKTLGAVLRAHCPFNFHRGVPEQSFTKVKEARLLPFGKCNILGSSCPLNLLCSSALSFSVLRGKRLTFLSWGKSVLIKHVTLPCLPHFPSLRLHLPEEEDSEKMACV